MKCFLKSMLAFSVFFVVIYSLLIFLWGNFAPQRLKPNLNYRIGSYGHMFSRLKELKTIDEVDLLFLGSSHAYRGFDPRVFKKELSKDIEVFNLGSSAQTPIETELLLSRYLDKLNPKTVIYEVYPGTFSSDGVESSLDVISNDINDLSSVRMAMNINHIKTWNTLIFGSFWDFFGLNSVFIEPKQKGNDKYVPGGYVEKKLTHYKYMKYSKKQWEFKKSQFDGFERCLSVIQNKNIRLIFVYAPITSALYRSYVNNDIFDTKMQMYGEYYNFNEIIELDDSFHFYDSHHLNQRGVNIFNKKLIDVVFLKNEMIE